MVKAVVVLCVLIVQSPRFIGLLKGDAAMIKRNLPLMITLAVFVLGYLYCLTQFPGFASTRVICNILTDNAFLGIIAVGMTFVIPLRRDRSVGGVGDRLYRRLPRQSDWLLGNLAAGEPFRWCW